MNVLRKLSCIWITLVTGVVASGAAQSATNDLAALQGEWSMASGVADGQPMPDFILKGARRTCEGDQITAVAGGQIILKATIKLDPSKTPKAIDYDVTDGPNKGKQLLGIYQLEGDTLKSCFAAPGAERPNAFESKPGDMRTFTIWKRKATLKVETK